MAIDFPNSPTTNDTFTIGERKWVYDGEKWALVPASPELLVVGPTAPTNTNVIWADTSVTGVGVVPVGGATGQVLAKNSSTNYDAGWATPVTPSDLTLKANLASPTFTGGQVTVSGTGDTSVKINSTSGYAIQYFAINGTNRWHYEVAPSYQTWGLVETGVGQRVTVNAGTGNLKLETGQVVTPNQYSYNGDNTGGGYTVYNGESVKPPNTYLNVGSCFNVSNGRFTVPVAGYVLCSFNSLVTRSLNASHAYVEFQVDGVKKSVRNHTMYDIGGNYTNLSNTAIVYCPANSYVTCNLWTPQSSTYADIYGLGLTFRFLG